MSPNFNDSYISAVTASTENHDQSFISKDLENTNDILLLIKRYLLLFWVL